VRALRGDERRWAATIIGESWGDVVITRGRELRPAELPALVAEADGERAGLATYLVEDSECELVTLDALTVGGGIGSALVEAVADAARGAGCARVVVITTNDNLPALRLYQRHGFVLAALRLDEIERSRRRKPQIAATGYAGIPIRDELELHRALAA
jgi:GNAT superfamily N-acetyltransferase